MQALELCLKVLPRQVCVVSSVRVGDVVTKFTSSRVDLTQEYDPPGGGRRFGVGPDQGLHARLVVGGELLERPVLLALGATHGGHGHVALVSHVLDERVGKVGLEVAFWDSIQYILNPHENLLKKVQENLHEKSSQKS